MGLATRQRWRRWSERRAIVASEVKGQEPKAKSQDSGRARDIGERLLLDEAEVLVRILAKSVVTAKGHK